MTDSVIYFIFAEIVDIELEGFEDIFFEEFGARFWVKLVEDRTKVFSFFGDEF